jgi:prepilin-type N-terminal cleavage/methylation domain-containing protein
MKFPKLGLINKNQRGFTLIELLVAMAISGIITGGITTTIFQVVIGSARTNNHMIAVSQVRDAGYWVSLDAQMAQHIIFDDPATSGVTEFLTLTWTDWGTNGGNSAVHRVAYTLEDMTGGSKQLKRIHTSTIGGTTTTVETGIIAQFIDPATTKCKLSGGGTFTLPDTNDTFTITGGAVTDSVTITAVAGSVSANGDGGATYSSGTGVWTIPVGGTVTVSRSGTTGAGGIWTSTTSSATVAISTDTDGDASVTGRVLTLTVTATVQNQSETRVYEIVPRPG